MKRFFCVIPIFVITIGAAFLTSLPSLAMGADLLTIYQQAKDSDPSFDGARYSREAVQQKVIQARAVLLPNIGLSGGKNHNQARAAFTGVRETERPLDSWNWNIQLTQPIVRMQAVHAYYQSTAQAEAAEAQLAAAEQDLILRVAQAYFEVLVAENAVLTLDAQWRAMHEQWAQAKQGFKSGVQAITDVHEAKAKAEEARAQQVSAQNELDNKRSELEKITGVMPPKLAQLGARGITPALNPSHVEDWIEQSKTQNPVVRMQEYLLQAAESEISRNRAEHLPTVDLVASRGQNYSSGSFTTPTDYFSRYRSNQIGLQANIPIFAGGGTSARVSEARANRGRVQAELEETRRKAVAETRQAYAAITSGIAKIEALDAAIEAGESSVKGNQVGYKIGLRINSDVLMAEQQLYQSRHEQFKARCDVLLQGLKLQAAVGILNAEGLAEINQQLKEN